MAPRAKRRCPRCKPVEPNGVLRYGLLFGGLFIILAAMALLLLTQVKAYVAIIFAAIGGVMIPNSRLLELARLWRRDGTGLFK